MLLLILLAELIILYFLSRLLTKTLFTFFLLIFRARSVAISILLVLEFPGTVIHELSHLFTAGILGVKTGKLSLEPESIQTEDITTGSVAIAETDPFRRFAIGLAPMIGGMIILTTIAYFLQQYVPNWNDWRFWGLGYLLFAVSNAMFSSPQDLKGFVPFAVTLAIFLSIFYYLGLRIAVTGETLTVATQVVTTLVNSLGVVLAVNLALWAITGLLTTLLMKLFRVKLRKY